MQSPVMRSLISEIENSLTKAGLTLFDHDIKEIANMCYRGAEQSTASLFKKFEPQPNFFNVCCSEIPKQIAAYIDKRNLAWIRM